MGKAKLSDQQVAQIRTLYRVGIRPKILMQRFYIDRSTLWRIVNGYAHKPQPETSFPQGQK